MKFGSLNVCAAVAAAVVVSSLASATPVTVGFTRITSTNVENPASQFSCVVSDVSPGVVNFRFLNNVGIDSSICDIYFDDGTLLGISAVSDSGVGVAFHQFATPGDLP